MIPARGSYDEFKDVVLRYCHRNIDSFSHADMATHFGLVLLEDKCNAYQLRCGGARDEFLRFEWSYGVLQPLNIANIREFLEVYYQVSELKFRVDDGTIAVARRNTPLIPLLNCHQRLIVEFLCQVSTN